MKGISSCCTGESHKSNNKPCQDCAFSESSASLSMAIVSDGHGGERYFRSDIGSKIVVEVIKESVKDFAKNLNKSTQKKYLGKELFANMPFVQYPTEDNSNLLSEQKRQADYIHEALDRLFSSIIYQWNNKISEHADNNPLNEWEIVNVPQKYQDEFNAKRNDPTETFEKFYGCTFMAYVQTKTYWFAFHLGDGKCVMFDVVDEKPRFSQPIPWDEKCFLNKTTSICDSNPLSEIRYCYCGNGTFPEAMFLGSDGIDDSFGDGERLYNFYIQVYNTLAVKGKNGTEEELDESLPIISQKGSKDDMSVACIYNEQNLGQNVTILKQYQIEKIEKQLESVEKCFSDLTLKIERYQSLKSISEKEQIECRYAEIDWRKNVELEAQLYAKLGKLGIEKQQPERLLSNQTTEDDKTKKGSSEEVTQNTQLSPDKEGTDTIELEDTPTQEIETTEVAEVRNDTQDSELEKLQEENIDASDSEHEITD